MKRSLKAVFVAAATAAISGSAALAQQTIPTGNTVITQWGFDNPNTVTIGSGSMTASSALGVAYQAPLFNTNPNLGASNDNNVASQINNGYLNVNGEFPTDPSGEGVGFLTSTAREDFATGDTGITFSWDQKVGSRASKYWQVVYTTNGGSTWQPVPSGGVGTTTPTSLGDYTTANVSSAGLVAITAPTGINSSTMALETTGGGWIDGLSYTFPTGGAWENNPGFGVGLEAIYNPFESVTTATDYGYVAADNGINSSDATNGFVRSAGSGGGDRYDMLTVSAAAVPEPASIGLLCIGSLAVLRRRRHQA